jgi:predicted nucleotidyltransferase
MTMLLEKFVKAKKIHPPEWLISNCHFLANSGSHAYGTHNEFSDIDIFGFCTPPKHIIFPHLAGVIKNFGDQGQCFDRWGESHIIGDDNLEYDFSVLNIVNFFHLCMKNNPDQLDVLFVPRECIRHITSTGEIVRDNRHKFLSKQVFWRYKGYAYSQLNKAEKEQPVGKRKILRDKFGFDPKFLCHLYRLVLEAEQILTEGDLDLRRNKEQVKYVKEGNVPLEEATKWFSSKEKQLEELLLKSKLPESPDENEIKAILLKALEHHYGSLDKAINLPNTAELKLEQIRKILES